MPHNMHLSYRPLDLSKQDPQVLRHHRLREHGFILRRFRAIACTTVIRHDYVVAGVREGSNDAAELVPGLREAVDEEDSAFRLDARGGMAGDVVELDAWFAAGV